MTTIMIVAGEASGDLLGADLMKAITSKNPEIKFIGVGGSAMEEQGLKSAFPLEELAVMGLVEVIPHLPKLSKRLKQLEELAVSAEIDALVTIDAQAFSAQLAKRVKNKLNIPCIQYVAPKVWAWRADRVKKMVQYVDHVLALLPFEAPYFEKYGLPCTFVGHPIMQRMKSYIPKKTNICQGKTLAVFPGSRVTEVKRHWPIMQKTIEELQSKIEGLEVILPIPKGNNEEIKKHLGQIPANIHLVEGDQRFEALKNCRAALGKSGTGNLELAVMRIPMVVGYKTNWLTYMLAKYLVKVPYISLVNWVARKKVVPEYIQQEFTPNNLVPALEELLVDDKVWQKQADNLALVRTKLNVQKPAEQAADVVLSYIQ
ncbi:MAG: lipid-A-disaccharide synthase [Alphaproteobacteria bacterium]|nr:lipid-A-disaccharide synthase [Alphaproteobacteria bacterium]MDD9920393.1 lipid-A-disaccharide synthase [Alphaproteobacteria bacterium]